MRKHFFWIQWQQPYRSVTSFLFLLLVLLATAVVVLVFIGSEGILGWHTYSIKTGAELVAQTINIGPFSFPVTERLVVIKEFFAGGAMPATLTAKYILWAVLAFSLSLLLAAISYFKRWGFMLFAGGLFFFATLLHPEMLKLGGLGDTWLMALTFLILIGPSYYFQSFGRHAGFMLRWLSIAGVLVLFVVGLAWQSQVLLPYNALASYGMLAPYLVVLFFVFLVGHEVVQGFAAAIAGGHDEPGNNRMKHILVISFIYLLNVLISYLQVTHVIDWNYVTISPFILLVVASVLGVWGIHWRYKVYAKVQANAPVWVMLYLSIAIISLASIAYFMWALEDPFLKIISDFILFTQLAFGLAFLFYLLYNFISYIEEGHPLVPVLYQPSNLPYLTYRMLGMAIITGLVLMRDIKYPIWYSLGGYYNSIAGYFEDRKDDELIEAFYLKGADLSKKNHKSNYKLGMHFIDTDHEQAIKYFGEASKRVPTPQAFVNKANLEKDEGMYFEALFTLQQGLSQFPDNEALLTNTGVQFAKAGLLDSAWFYLSKSAGKLAQNNALAMVLQNQIQVSSLDSAYLFTNLNAIGKTNAAALGVQTEPWQQVTTNKLTGQGYLNNLIVSNLIPYDSANYRLLSAMVDGTKHAKAKEQLSYSLALYAWRHERINDAINRLQELTSLTQDKQHLYFEMLGLLHLNYRSYAMAAHYFTVAMEAAPLGTITGLRGLALAQSELGEFEEAITHWKELAAKTALEEQALEATVMQQVLTGLLNETDSVATDDMSLYLRARYARLWKDEFEVKKLWEAIKDLELKNNLALDLAQYYFETGNADAAIRFYSFIVPNQAQELQRAYDWLGIKMAYAGVTGNLTEQVAAFKAHGFDFRPDERLEALFFTANLENLSKGQLGELASSNPFFAEGVVWAAGHSTNPSNNFAAYEMLQAALEQNPDNRILLEAYILEAIQVGFDTYANTSLLHYRELFPGDLYYRFEQKVMAKRAEVNLLVEQDEE